MLMRYNDRIYSDRHSMIIDDGHLCLRIGTQPGYITSFPKCCRTLEDPMAEHDWCRHQFGSLRAGIPKHHALVTCTLQAERTARSIDSHCNIRRLLMEEFHYLDSLVIETGTLDIVAYFLDDFPDQRIDVKGGMCGDLSTYHYSIGGSECFTGNTRIGVFCQTRIEDSIGYLVTNLVWMSLTYRFTCEHLPTVSQHNYFSSYLFPSQWGQFIIDGYPDLLEQSFAFAFCRNPFQVVQRCMNQ